MKPRKINDLPDGMRNRLIRLTAEFAILSNKNVGDRVKALDVHCISYKMWQTRSYHLMKAVNEKLVAEGKSEKNMSLPNSVHGVPVVQCYFHVYRPSWRSKPQGENDWTESNLLDRFIDLLRIRPYTRKELGYIALKNGYTRTIVTQCLDLLLILEYVDLWDDTYLYLLIPEINPEDVW